jgi:signal transduction histidine kinase
MEETQRRMTDHAWQQGKPQWDLYFGMVLAATLIIVQLENDSTAYGRLIATGLIAAMAPWYVFVGRSELGRPDDSPRGTLYVLGLFPLLGIAQANMGSSSFMLFTLAAQCFILLSVGRALLALVGLNLVPLYFIVSGRLNGHPQAVAITVLFVLITIAFAGVLGVWIDRIIRQSRDRADLIEQLETTRAELAQAHRMQGMLAERQRMAGEIHDTLAQGFTSILMLLQAADPLVTEESARRPLELAIRTARENLAEARALVAALPPVALDSAPLPDALQRLAGQLGEELGIPVTYETRGEIRSLAAGTEVVLLRATQEAFANIRKHAAARSASVRLEYDLQAVRLRVSDDGVGFDPQFAKDGHFGLRGIRDRATQIGGCARIDSAPGEGSILTIELPTAGMADHEKGREVA